MFRRKRFGDLIAMQLDVFAVDHADRLQSLREALAQYRAT
jgi:hypothetical protein